jgi:hypothetical protein
MEMGHMVRGFEVEGSTFDYAIGPYHEPAPVRSGAATRMQVYLLGFGLDVKERIVPK